MNDRSLGSVKKYHHFIYEKHIWIPDKMPGCVWCDFIYYSETKRIFRCKETWEPLFPDEITKKRGEQCPLIPILEKEKEE